MNLNSKLISRILGHTKLFVLSALLVASTANLSPVVAAGEIVGREQTIIDMTNAVRAKAGVGHLVMDARLMRSAQAKANDMAQKSYFDHANPDGYRMIYWIKPTGYEFTLAGENLARGFTDIDRLMNGWINSPGHYKNLVEPKFQDMGVGIATGIYENAVTIFVVQHFGAPAIAADHDIHQVASDVVTPAIAPFVSPAAAATPDVAEKGTPISLSLLEIQTAKANTLSVAPSTPTGPASQIPAAKAPVWLIITLIGLSLIIFVADFFLLERVTKEIAEDLEADGEPTPAPTV